ncbi:sugar phosphate isomerase/epimerase family protein [Cohnella cellulosilytica]|uniref:Sugar phosphate isomerase/epimerase family protein n=1 Tax=Cohnella cellulosilytica TaxID=986710 RepID=A0ABW2F5D9_9BACL
MFPFRAALNASTLFPYKLGIREQIRIAAQAGYDGIEIWMKDLQQYAAGGGSAAELRREAADAGIEIANAISFIPWADDDEAVRRQAAAQTDEELALLAELGCPSFAAPPFGDVADASLDEIAERFAVLAERCRRHGVAPVLEFWGRAPKLNRLSEAVYVAMQSRVPDATLLLDPFHMYTGGSSLADLDFLSADRIGIVHANDYPEQPPRETIGDEDRLFPGDGIAPSGEFARRLDRLGYRGYLSLELFLRGVGGLSAPELARFGLDKMKSAYSV